MRSFTVKRAAVVLTIMIVALAWLGTAWAQDTGVFGSGGSGTGDGPFEFDFDGGVKVVFQELKEGGSSNYYFNVIFTVTSPEDMLFKISKANCIAYDNRGNEYNYDDLWIGNKDISERLIIGGVPTQFGFWFRKGSHTLADVYSRIDVNILDKVVTLRNVPSTK
ncbi:MAG: hypothetical protein QM441_05410 [Synergistota bacterium]|jgi:hypothetical protein|nr:hypothetical protein [Synergistota bacterium]OPZ38770.1 MAG: hypothetical protein BWY99_01546 [Synergistetes bacterium ADurb.BinA166]